MSNEIDRKVVEMQFDNRQFEEGISESLKSIDKLNKGLRFEDSSKGFDDISKRANKCDFSGLADAIDNISEKFSLLNRVAVNVLSNIATEAINTGIHFAKSLSIDQVTGGFGKYEQKIGGVQTIMAATGLSIEEVNAQLDKLNWFTDETSYNFTDMVDNIGKFTSNGVDLETSVTAMMGIANAAALAGQNSQSASRAMYNFAQALGTGAVKLIDWKSIENANMATTEFKQTIIDAALEAGTLVRSGDKIVTAVKKTEVSASNFNAALSEGWFTSGVLLKSLDRYGEYAETVYAYMQEAGDASLTTSEAMEIVSGETMLLGKRSFKAAQEAKTFTDAINSVKDAVSTGWSKTFENIFGDYSETRVYMTELANGLWDVFAGGGEYRNELLAEVFNSNWSKLARSVADAGLSVNEFQEKIIEVGKAHGITVDEMIEEAGSFEKSLAKEWVTADIVSEALGKLTVTTDDQREALSELSAEAANAESSLGEIISDISKPSGRALMFETMSNAVAAVANPLYAVREALSETFSSSAETNLYNFIKRTSQFSKKLVLTEDGAEKLKNILVSIFENLSKAGNYISGAFTEAWNGAKSVVLKFFEGIDTSGIVQSFTDATDKVKNWVSENEIIPKISDAAGKAVHTLGSIAESAGILIGKAAGKIKDFVEKILSIPAVSSTLDRIGGKISGFFASFGEGVDGFLDKIKNLDSFSLKDVFGSFDANKVKDSFPSKDDILGAIPDYSEVKTKVEGVFSGFGEDFLGSSIFGFGKKKDVSTSINSYVSSFSTGIFSGVKEFSNTLPDIFGGIGKTISDFVSGAKYDAESLAETAVESGNAIVAAAETTEEDSRSFLQRAVDGITWFGTNLKTNFTAIIGNFSGLGGSFKKTIINIMNDSRTFAIAFGLLAASVISSFTKAIDSIMKGVQPISKSIQTMSTSVSGFFNELKTTVSNFNKNKKYDGIKKFAIAITLMAASLIVLMGVTDDVGKLITIAGVLAVLSGVMTGLAAISTVIKPEGYANMLKMSLAVTALAGALAVLAIGIKMFPKDVRWSDLGKIAVSLLGVVAIAVAFDILLTIMDPYQVNLVAASFLMFAGATLAVIGALKLISKIDYSAGDVAALAVIMISLAVLVKAVSHLGPDAKKAALAAIPIVIAVELLALCMKTMRKIRITGETIGNLVICTAALGVLMLETKLAGENAAKAGLGLVGIVAALFLFAKVMDSMGNIFKKVGDGKTVLKSIAIISGILAAFAGLLYMLRGVSENAAKAGLAILEITAAITLLGVIVKLAGVYKWEEIVKGIAMIGGIAGAISLMLWQMKGIGDASKTISALGVALIELSVCFGILSFLPWEQVGRAVVSLVAVMGMFSVMMLSAKGLDKGIPQMIILASIVAIVAGIFVAMDAIDVQNSIQNGVGIGSVLLGLALMLKSVNAMHLTKTAIGQFALISGIVAALSGIMGAIALIPFDKTRMLALTTGMSEMLVSLGFTVKLLQNYTTVDKSVIWSVVLLSAIVAALSILMAHLAAMEFDPIKLLALTTGISEIILSMAVALGACALVGNFAKQAFAGILLLIAGMGLIGAFIAGVGYLNSTQPDLQLWLNNGLPILEKVAEYTGKLLGKMIVPLVALTIIGSFGTAALFGIVVFAAIIAAFGAMALGLGAWTEHWDNLEDFIEKGFPLLEKIAEGTGVVIGKFTGGIFEGITATLVPAFENIGKAIEVLNASPSIKDGILDSFDVFSNIMLKLAAQSFLNTITDILSFGSKNDFGKFGIQIKSFLTSYSGIIEEIEKVNTSDDIKDKLQCVLDLVDGFSKISFRTGGFWQKIIGENNPSVYSERLRAFVKSFVGANENSKGIFSLLDEMVVPEGYKKKIDVLADTVDKFSSIKIDKTGGIWQAITGQENLSTLGRQLYLFVEKWFKPLISVINDLNFGDNFGKKIDDIAYVIEKFSSIELDKSGGIWQAITGGQNLGDFGAALGKFSTGFKTFMDNVNEYDYSQVNTAMYCVSSFVESGIKAYDTHAGDGIKELGTGIKSYANSIKGVAFEDIDSSTDSLNKLVVAAQNISILDQESLKSFMGAMASAATDGVQAFADAVKNKEQSIKDIAIGVTFTFGDAVRDNGDYITTEFLKILSKTRLAISDRYKQFTSQGKTVVEEFTKGLSDTYKMFSLETAVNTIVGKVSEKLGTISAFDDGINVIKGFIEGLSDKKMLTAVETAGSNIAMKAIEGLERAAQIQSPSKVAMLDGAYTAIGYIVGIENNYDRVGEAASGLARVASEAIKNELGIHSPSKEEKKDGENTGIGFAQGIEESSETVYEMAEDIGYDANVGISDGIRNNLDIAREAALSLGQCIIDAIKERLADNPPSAVMETIGKDTVVGLANGVRDADDIYSSYGNYSSFDEGYDYGYSFGDGYSEGLKSGTESGVMTLAEEMEKIYNPRRQDLEYAVTRAARRIKARTLAENGEYIPEDLMMYVVDDKISTEALKYGFEVAMGKLRDFDKEMSVYTEWRTYDEWLREVDRQQKEAEAEKQKAETYRETLGESIIESIGTTGIDIDQLGIDPTELGNNVMDQLGNMDISSVDASSFGTAISGALSGMDIDLSSANLDMSSLGLSAMSSFKSSGLDLTQLGGYLGINLDEGFVNGLKNGASVVKDVAGKVLGSDIVVSISEKLGIHSPSTVSYSLGSFTVQGFVNALNDGFASVMNAGFMLANSAITGINIALGKDSELTNETFEGILSAVRNANDILSGDYEFSPVITPVVDISDAKRRLDCIGDMLSYKKASAVGLSFNGRKINETTENDIDPCSSGTTVNFTQNNYSPKALSRLDIYRQTKNQLSSMKKLVRT